MNDDYTPLDWLRDYNEAIRAGADPAAAQAELMRLHPQGMSLQGIQDAVRADRSAQSPAMQRLSERRGSPLAGGVSDFSRMAAQGATFNFADELAGAVAAITPGGRGYREARDASRQRVSGLKETSPRASQMAEIAGGFAVPFTAGTGLAGKVAPEGASLLMRSLGGAIGGGTAAALASGLAGAGEGQTPQERLQNAGANALFGGALGVGLGAAAPIAGAVATGVGRVGGRAVRPVQQGVSDAARRMRGVLEETPVTPGNIQRRMNELGPGAVIADLDPRLAREARSARNLAASLDVAEGPVQGLMDRGAQRGERIARDLRAATGLNDTFEAGLRAARGEVKQGGRRLYGSLERDFAEVPVDALTDVLTNRRVQQTLNTVRRETAEAIGTDNFRPYEAGGPVSFKELQETVWMLDDEIAGLSGRDLATNRARSVKAVRDQLQDAMREDIPGYRTANDTYRGMVKKVEAYETGYKGQGKTATQIREEIAQYEPGSTASPELRAGLEEAVDAYRVGYLHRMEEQLRGFEGGRGPANAVTRAGGERLERIEALFPEGDPGYEQFLYDRGLERVFQQTENTVRGNSTSLMQAADMIDSAPTSKNQLAQTVWRSLFDSGEAARTQNQTVGEVLMGSDTQRLIDMVNGRGLNTPLGRIPLTGASPRMAGGVAGAVGSQVGNLLGGSDIGNALKGWSGGPSQDGLLGPSSMQRSEVPAGFTFNGLLGRG